MEDFKILFKNELIASYLDNKVFICMEYHDEKGRLVWNWPDDKIIFN